MTGEPFPRFDLYGELEVSPLASVGSIEAAYRSLVKRHHPDVAGSPDDERMKRLNLARDWLTDPIRRSRYDASRARVTVSAMMRPRDGGPGLSQFGPDGEAPAPSFGVNAGQVRDFLGELRGLDAYRARQVWDGRAVAHLRGYTLAQRAADSIGRSKRHDEWLFAREAASVIARGELGDSTLTEQVLDVVADAAGAIAIRDLLSAQSFDVLLLPWRWRGAPVAGRVVPPAPPVAVKAEPRPSVVPPSEGATPPSAPAPTPVAPTPAQMAPAPPYMAASPPVAAALTPAGQETVVAPQAPAAATPLASPAPVMPPPAPATAVETGGLVAAAAPPSIQPAATPPQQVSVGPEPTHVPPAAPGADGMRSGAASRGPEPPRPGSLILTAEPAPGLRQVRAAVTGYRESNGLAAPPNRRRPGTPLLWPALASIAALAVIWGLIGLIKPPSDQAVAGITDAPSSAAQTLEPPPATDSTVDPSAPSATDPGSSVPGGVTGPTATPRAGRTPGPGPTPPPGPGKTPHPTPQPTPTPGPTPTPAPTPTPPPGMCAVISLIGSNSANAQVAWNTAGFTGTVVFSPAIPPQWKIQAQSLVVDAVVPCTSGITVYKVAP